MNELTQLVALMREMNERLARMERQPESTLVPASVIKDAAKHLTAWLEMKECECEGIHICGYEQVRSCRDALLSAEQTMRWPAEFDGAHHVAGDKSE